MKSAKKNPKETWLPFPIPPVKPSEKITKQGIISWRDYASEQNGRVEVSLKELITKLSECDQLSLNEIFIVSQESECYDYENSVSHTEIVFYRSVNNPNFERENKQYEKQMVSYAKKLKEWDEQEKLRVDRESKLEKSKVNKEIAELEKKLEKLKQKKSSF